MHACMRIWENGTILEVTEPSLSTEPTEKMESGNRVARPTGTQCPFNRVKESQQQPLI